MGWNWGQTAEVVGQFVTSGAIIFGALVAKEGLKTWRHEALGKRKIDLAEQAAQAFIRARDGIREIRAPLMLGGELAEVERVFSEGKEMDVGNLPRPPLQFLGTIHRMQQRYEVFTDLEKVRPLFTVYFGNETEELFETIRKIHNRIGVAGQQLIRIAQRSGLDREPEIVQLNQSLIWDHGEDDELNLELKTAVDAAIKKCKKILRPD